MAALPSSPSAGLHELDGLSASYKQYEHEEPRGRSDGNVSEGWRGEPAKVEVVV
jgi:hypothetical protein